MTRKLAFGIVVLAIGLVAGDGGDRKQRQRNQERLTAALDALDRGQEPADAYLELAFLAHYSETQEQSIDRLRQELTARPSNLLVAYAYHIALVGAERYELAQEAAWAIWEAECSADGSECSAGDDAFLKAVVARLRVGDKASLASPTLDASEALARLKSALKEAIHAGDQVSVDYAVPPRLRHFVHPTSLHPALVARRLFIGYAIEGGERHELERMVGEYVGLCPQYESRDRCLDLERELREHTGLGASPSYVEPDLSRRRDVLERIWQGRRADVTNTMARDAATMLPGMSMEEVLFRLGPPDLDHGAYLYYDLETGSRLVVGFTHCKGVVDSTRIESSEETSALRPESEGELDVEYRTVVVKQLRWMLRSEKPAERARGVFRLECLTALSSEAGSVSYTVDDAALIQRVEHGESGEELMLALDRAVKFWQGWLEKQR